MVQERETITKRRPLQFDIDLLGEDSYHITVSRELRKLKAAGLINYENTSVRFGTYHLLSKDGKYTKTALEKMLIEALVHLDKPEKSSNAADVRRLLNDLARNLSKACKTSEGNGR
jgi:hypothetical protein